MGAPWARMVPVAAPSCRNERGLSSWPTGKVEAARTAGAIPVGEEAARVAVEGTPAAVVEASPAVAAGDTLVAVAVVVEPVADTTNPPSHCTDLSK